MSRNSERGPLGPARVLLFSHRNIFRQEVWRCSFQEFEGLLPQIDAVDVVAPSPQGWYPWGKRAALRVGKHLRLPMNPGIPEIRLDRDYDLFFTICEKPSELLHLQALKGWRDRCKTSVCWLPEFYVKDIPILKSSLEVLAQFDHVLFMFDANEPFRRIIRGQGQYLPAGIDAVRFCPYPDPPARCIDVLSIGRRSEVTHQALLEMARSHDFFYVYDTLTELNSYSLAQHRALFANMAKRSRYFIVNPGKINAPEETGGQSEFGYRYFEGAAPGTIMIGDRPNNRQFDRVFHWEDAAIYLPFGSDQVGSLIRELDRQPERQARIRRTNIVQCLLHHDWVYRWETVLQTAGLDPLPSLLARKERLRDLAATVEEQIALEGLSR